MNCKLILYSAVPGIWEINLEKKRVLFVGESFSLAHIARPLYLAESLDPNEYDIHFACDQRYQSIIEHNPFHFWNMDSISGDEFLDAQRKGGFVPDEKDIESNIEKELLLIRELEPSIIINDLRFSMTISAEITNTRLATLANAHWSPYRDLGFDPYPPPNDKVNAKMVTETNKKRPSATNSFNRIREKYSIPPLRDYCDLATRGDFTLYTEPRGFISTKNLPRNHFFIGPILWEPKVKLPPWWNSWNQNLPIIYITLGSTGAAEYLQEIIKSIQELPVIIITATAGRFNFGNIPGNVYLADYLPGIEASKLASVVICNGGSATAYQALSQGTPLIGIWSNLDQYLTMMNIERKGIGIGVNANGIELEKLKSLVSTLIEDNHYKEKALGVKKLFTQYNSKLLFNKFLKETL